MAKLPNLESLIITVYFSGIDADVAFALPQNHGRHLAKQCLMALYLSQQPKDISKGYVFGSDPESCDVLLANTKDTGISGNHFSIQIDWESRNPVLSCHSRNHLDVEVLGKETNRLLSKGAWQVLKTGTSTSVQINQGLRLQLSNPRRDLVQDIYDRNVQSYLRDFKNAVPELANFSLEDADVTPFIMYRCPGVEGREYYATQRIETGDSGYDAAVCLYNAKCKSKPGLPTTTQEVARINIGRPEYSSHAEEQGDLADMVLSKVQGGRPSELYVVKHFRRKINPLCALPRQISELRSLSHLNVEDVVDLITETSGFMTLVNSFSHHTLHSLHQESPLSTVEAGFVMGQIFAALTYLHASGWAHGNVDPRSILVMSRKCLWVKLADTALSDYVALGKPSDYHALYAPHRTLIGNKGPADIWSAGVVALQLLLPDGLPGRERLEQTAWARKLQKIALCRHQEFGNEETAFVQSVLIYDPRMRPKAAEVLKKPWIEQNKGDISFDNTPSHSFTAQGWRHTTSNPSNSSSRQGSAAPSNRSTHRISSSQSHHTSVGPSYRSDSKASSAPPTSVSHGDFAPGSRHTSVGPSRQSSRHSSISPFEDFIDWSQCQESSSISGTVSNNRSRSTSTDSAVRDILNSRPYPGDDWNDFDSENQSVASQSTNFTVNPLALEPDMRASLDQSKMQSRPSSLSSHSRSRRSESPVSDWATETSGRMCRDRETGIGEQSGEETATEGRREPVKKKRRRRNGQR